MDSFKNEDEFRQMLLSKLPSLSKQQQVAGAFLLDHLSEATFLSVPAYAKKAGVSDATVVRLGQSLGFDGYAGLKMALMELARDKMNGGAFNQKLFGEDEKETTLRKTAEQEVSNIQRTIQGITPEQFQKVVSVLFKADHIYSFGMGVSAHVADLFSYWLVQIGLRATTVSTRSSSPLEQLVPLRLTDLVVVFSFPPYSKPTIEMVKDLKERGIPTLAICDSLAAPVAAEASHSLTVRTDSMMFTNSLSALFVVLNSLVTEIVGRHGDAVNAVSRINRIITQDDNLI